jgi:hypothetical protein
MKRFLCWIGWHKLSWVPYLGMKCERCGKVTGAYYL